MLAWMLFVSATATAIYSSIHSVSTDYPEWLGAIPLSLIISAHNILSRIASQLQASRLHNNKDRNCHPIFCNIALQHNYIYVLILGSGLEYRFEECKLLKEVVFCILGCVFFVALTCFVCMLQLGLDQMPDASSSSMMT